MKCFRKAKKTTGAFRLENVLGPTPAATIHWELCAPSHFPPPGPSALGLFLLLFESLA